MIVVTGGAGFIGSVLVWKLNERGRRDILVVDENARGRPKWTNLEKRAFEGYCDHDDFLDRVEGGDYEGRIEGIFHMGAISDTTARDRDRLDRHNTDYSRRLAAWAVARGVRFLYASSAATYGAGELGWQDDDEVVPRLKPLNLYGESKQRFDRWVLENGHRDRVAGFKFFNVFGPNEYHKGDMRSMVHKGWGQVKEAGRIRLFKSYRPDYADGEQRRDFVYVKDAADVLMWFWDHPRACGIYNVGSGAARSWNDLASSIFAALDRPRRIEYVPMPEALRDQYQYHTEADLSKLRSAGCDVPFRTLEEAVADYVKGHLEKADPYL